MDTHKFTGNGAILVFDSLTRMVEETEKLFLSKEQACNLLLQFLTNPGATQFRAGQSGSHFSGITCWPEAVQYFLQTYATPSTIWATCARVRIMHSSLQKWKLNTWLTLTKQCTDVVTFMTGKEIGLCHQWPSTLQTIEYCPLLWNSAS